MRFMSLSFGASLVVAGAIFVLSGVTTPQTDGSLQWRDIKMAMASKSPGLFLVLLGCCLIAIPNVFPQRIGVDDTSTYIQKYNLIVKDDQASLSEEQLKALMKRAE